jgi:hypothetical protein
MTAGGAAVSAAAAEAFCRGLSARLSPIVSGTVREAVLRRAIGAAVPAVAAATVGADSAAAAISAAAARAEIGNKCKAQNAKCKILGGKINLFFNFAFYALHFALENLCH